MKNLLLSTLLLFSICILHAQSQAINYIYGDVISLEKRGGTTELQIKNSTATIPGYLYNQANGLTRFKTAVDSLWAASGNLYWKIGGIAYSASLSGGPAGGNGIHGIYTTSPIIKDNDSTFHIQVANASQGGYLSNTDWNIFNNKLGSIANAGVGYRWVAGTSNVKTALGGLWFLIDSSILNSLRFSVDSAGMATYFIRRKDSGVSYVTPYQLKQITCVNGLNQPGYVTWSGTGLTFNVTAARYTIDCNSFASNAGTITLDAADPTNPRYDVIAVDNTGAIVKIAGVPATNPTIPQVDPATQVLLTTVYIPAGSSVPANISQLIIYDENAETFAGTATNLTVNFNNTSTVFKNSKSANVSSYTSANNRQIDFTKASGTEDASNYLTLNFHINLKTALANNSNLRVSFLNNSTVVSSVITAASSNGFTKTTAGSYQDVTIPVSAFSFTSTTFNRVRFTVTGAGDGFYLDYVQLQSGVVQQTPESDPIAQEKTITVLSSPDVVVTGTTQKLRTNPSFSMGQVQGIRGAIVPSLTTGYLKYNGTAWTFDNSGVSGSTASNQIDVFLLVGQSNSVGQGNKDSSVIPKDSTAYQFKAGVLSAAIDPVGDANTGSAWPSFARTYYSNTNRKILFVPAGKGNTAQAAAADAGNGNWDTTGTLYSASLARLDSAVNAAKLAGFTPIFRGILWGQGELDASKIQSSTITGTVYYNSLKNMIRHYRIDLGATTPFYIFRTGTKFDGTNAGFDTVRARQEQVVAEDILSQIVFRDAIEYDKLGLMQSVQPLHYLQEGYNLMGRKSAQAIVRREWENGVSNQHIKNGFNNINPQGVVAPNGSSLYPALVLGGNLPIPRIAGALEYGNSNYYGTLLSTARKRIIFGDSALPVTNSVPYHNSDGTVAASNLFTYNNANPSIQLGSALPQSNSTASYMAVGTNAGITLQKFGGGVITTALVAQGTQATPTLVTNDMILYNLAQKSYNGTAYPAGTNTGIIFKASEDASSTSSASRMEFYTTPFGSLSSSLNGYFTPYGTLVLSSATGIGAPDSTRLFVRQGTNDGSGGIIEMRQNKTRGFLLRNLTDTTNNIVFSTTSNSQRINTGTQPLFINGSNTNNVAIGTNTNIASAQFAVSSTTKGFLMPTLTTTQMNAVSTPATGLMIYNTTDNLFYYYNGTAWTSILPSGSGSGNVTATAGLSQRFTIYNGTTTTTYSDAFYDTAKKLMSINNGSFSSGNYPFQVYGTSTFPGTVSSGSFVINGTGTSFRDDFLNGDTLVQNGNSYAISSVGSNTQLNTVGAVTPTFTSASYTNISATRGAAVFTNNGTLKIRGRNYINFSQGSTYIGTPGLSAGANTAVGYQALNGAGGSQATAVGYQTLQNNTGNYATAFGAYAGKQNQSSEFTAFGYNAGPANTTGNSNIFVGFNSGLTNTTGNNLTALGSNSLSSNNIGSNSTALGNGSLGNLTGNNGNNIGIGTDAFKYNTGGTTPATAYNNVIAIGASVKASAATGLNNIIVIAAGGVDHGSNTTTIGTSATTDTYFEGTTALHITLGTAPSSATATGAAGTAIFATDGNLYICTATNTWKKFTSSTF